MEQKEEKGVFLVQREGRVSIPRKMRERLRVQQGSFVLLSIKKATDEEIIADLKKINEKQ